MKTDCWKREKKTSYVEENEENSKFMTHSQVHDISNDIWFLDSGYSNHMSGIKSIFRDIDETHKLKVRLGDNKQIQVEEKGTIEVKTNQEKVKYLDNVFFIPTLSHNLLSIGQLIDDRYSVIFNYSSCTIKNKKFDLIIVNVCMTQNKMFPLDVSNIERHALVVTQKNESSL